MPPPINHPSLRPYPVKVHNYLPRPTPDNPNQDPNRPLQVYEHLTTFSSLDSNPQNALVFIGGLGDGPHTIPYVRRLAEHLATTEGGKKWGVFEARLTSAFTGFGHSSLKQDAKELGDLVRYLRSEVVGSKGKVVLMGHSTGCQDCLEYGTKYGPEWEEEERVDGFVLQGPVSDREAVTVSEDMEEVRKSLAVAREMVAQERGEEVIRREEMPKGWRAIPVTAGRWCSLVDIGGDDDYFSSDLPDSTLQQIWGKLSKPVLILPSGKDEWVPAKIDVPALMKRWMSFCAPGIASPLSGFIPGANHRVDNEEGKVWLNETVGKFLEEVDARE